MKLNNFFKSFLNDESGAVTVDWVVLSAAIVGLGLVVLRAVGLGAENLAASIADDMDTQTTYVAQRGAGTP